jgi:hypothetical protein
VAQITMQMVCQRCRRLVASGCLPERAGQPTQIVLHMDLNRLRGLPGAAGAEAAWAGQAPAGPGDDCDAQIVPVVTGRLDPQVLDRLAAALLHATPAPVDPATPEQRGLSGADAATRARAERAARPRPSRICPRAGAAGPLRGPHRC